MNLFGKFSIKIIIGITALLLGAALLIWGVSHPSLLIIDNNTLSLSSNKYENPFVKEPLNILFLGISGDGNYGALLTDTIFVTHLNFQSKKIIVISLPRDLWVRAPQINQNVKINSLYTLSNPGSKNFLSATKYDLIQTKIEEITGLKINYVVIFDLKGFGQLVDALGGLNIYLDKEMIDPRFTNPHDPSSIFDLTPGWHYLDGQTAIKFVRTRYAPNGDFYRIDNQHLVLAALKDKIAQLSHVWNLMTWFKIYESISNHYLTNLDFPTLWNLLNAFKNTQTNNIQYLSITNKAPDNLLISSSVEGFFNNATTSVYILLPKEGFEQYNAIQNYLKQFIND